jgi:FkbM family methyltransferase
MLEKIISIYVFLFGRARFKKFNKLLYLMSLGGLGILNYRNMKDSGEKSFLAKYLKKNGGVLIDVGANQGNYSLEAITVCPNIKVFAFEPHPITFRSLYKNVESHENIFTVNKGMSWRKGVSKLYDHFNKDGSSHASLFQDIITEFHGAELVACHEIELTTIDDFLYAENINEIDLLKIDTEGNELEVLRGGANAIKDRKIKAIQFEFNVTNVYSRTFFVDFWKILNGYRFYRLLPNEMLEIKKYEPRDCEIFSYQNIVAILKD